MRTAAEETALAAFKDAATSDTDPGYPHGAAIVPWQDTALTDRVVRRYLGEGRSVVMVGTDQFDLLLEPVQPGLLGRLRKLLRRPVVRISRHRKKGSPIRVLHRHESDGWWAESPDVEGWSAAGSTYSDVAKMAAEGVPFALGRDVTLEHFCLTRTDSPHLAAMIARGEVRPGTGAPHLPKPVRPSKTGKTASEYVSKGRD